MIKDIEFYLKKIFFTEKYLLNKNKSLQNLFRLFGIFKFTIYMIKKKSNLNFI